MSPSPLPFSIRGIDTRMLTDDQRRRLERHLSRLSSFSALLSTFHPTTTPGDARALRELRDRCVAELGFTPDQVDTAFDTGSRTPRPTRSSTPTEVTSGGTRTPRQ